MTRNLLYARNNAYDSILLVDGDKVIGAWTATARECRDFLDPGNLSDWAETYPDETSREAYGEILDHEQAVAVCRERIK